MNPLETYLEELWKNRCSDAGVKETSYYRPLAAHLNEIRNTLKVQSQVHYLFTGSGIL